MIYYVKLFLKNEGKEEEGDATSQHSRLSVQLIMLLILLMFHVNQAKYIDRTSSICVCSKSSLAVVHSSPVTDIRAKIQLPKLENANVRSTTTPSCRKSILEIVDCSVKTELGPALTTEPSSYIYKVDE